MQLTKPEKLALLMLCDIYDATAKGGEFDTKFIRSAIYTRNSWAFDASFVGIPDDDISEDVVTEVHDILDMWQFIEEAGGERFPGFDNNREAAHASVARFLTEHMGQWVSFKGRVGHGVVGLEGYRRMFKRFEPIRASLADRPQIALTPEEVALILAERVHPSNRG